MKRLLIALPLAAAGALWFWYVTLPWGLTLRWRDPQRTPLMELRRDQAAAEGETLAIRHDWVALDAISPHLRRAVIVAEDGRFHEHAGVDWLALREELRYQGDDDFSFFDAADLRALFGSLEYYRANRDRIRGRSTITQQVAKNLYFSNDRSVLRKVQELIVARRLERVLDKDRILELYLNVAEWGPGIFGAQAAAQHYFGRSAADLTREQAAALAATLPHPLTSNPAHRPGRMAWRRDLILGRMGGSGAVETVPLAPETIERPDVELEGVPLEPVDPDAAPDRGDAEAPPPEESPEAADDTVPAPRESEPVEPDTATGGASGFGAGRRS